MLPRHLPNIDLPIFHMRFAEPESGKYFVGDMILSEGVPALIERAVCDGILNKNFDTLDSKNKAHRIAGTPEDISSYVFALRARNPAEGRVMAKDLANYIRQSTENELELRLADLSYTLAQHNSPLEYVIPLRARSLNELADQLDNQSLQMFQIAGKATRLGFVFTGQGAQWHAMGRELFAAYPIFATAMEEADTILCELGAEWSLIDELARDAATSRLFQPYLAQTVTVALQICLVRLLDSWGIRPTAVASHSSGEIAAAFSVGALSFREALAVGYHCDQLIHKYQASGEVRGAMLAAGINATDAEKYIADTHAGGRVLIACINSSESLTLAGDADDIDEVLLRLEQDNRFARKLKVGVAYHSHHMVPMSAEYAERLCEVLVEKSLWESNIIYASPVTGRLMNQSDEFGPQHWVRNITDTVRFSEAVQAIASHVDAIIEIGPHNTLGGPLRQILSSQKMAYTWCLERNIDAVEAMQDLVKDLLGFGISVSLDHVNSPLHNQHPQLITDLSMRAWEHALGTNFQQPLHKLEWVPDVLHDIPAFIKEFLRINLRDVDATFEKKMVRASYYLIVDAVSQLEGEDRESWAPHFRMMYDWMLATISAGEQGQLGPSSRLWSRTSKGIKQSLFDELKCACISGRLLVRIGSNLANILRGQSTSLDLLAEDSLLNKFYARAPQLKSRAYYQLAQVVKLYAAKFPGAKVLEIGGGVAMATETVLEAFNYQKGYPGTLIGQYTLAGVSEDLLERSKMRLAHWGDLINFSQVDITSESLVHPFEEGEFDLIVAPLTLYKSKDLRQALRNARQFMGPNGHLLLVETILKKLDTQLIFGAQAESWLSGGQDTKSGPSLTIEQWDQTLRQTGFTGVDFEVGDCEQYQLQSFRVILSRVSVASAVVSPISIIHTGCAPTSWLTTLIDAIQKDLGSPATMETWDNVIPDNKIYIFTGDMTEGFPETLDQASIKKLQQLLSRSLGILWLSRGRLSNSLRTSPEHTDFQALLRNLRQTNLESSYVHLDFDPADPDVWSVDHIPHVCAVLDQSLNRSKSSATMDWEYAVRNKILHVPRIFPTQHVLAEPDTLFEIFAEHRKPSLQSLVSVVDSISQSNFQGEQATEDRDRRYGTLRLGRQFVVGSVAIGLSDAESNPADQLAQALEIVKKTQNDIPEHMIGPVAEAVASQLAVLLNADRSEISLDEPLSAQGVDSIAAVDLRNWLMAAGAVKMSVFELAEASSPRSLAASIVARKLEVPAEYLDM